MRYLFLSAFAAIVALTLVTAISYAQGVDRGEAAAIAELDAGAPDLGPYRTPGVVRVAAVVDAGVAAPSVQPHADPAADPGGAWAEFQALRKKGGPQIAFGFLIAVIAAAIRVRLQPEPGEEEPDPASWRARTVALLGAAAMLGWGVADRAAGAIAWSALVPIALAAGALVWRAINPPRGSKRATTNA